MHALKSGPALLAVIGLLYGRISRPFLELQQILIKYNLQQAMRICKCKWLECLRAKQTNKKKMGKNKNVMHNIKRRQSI